MEAEKSFQELADFVQKYENIFSRFLENSELSKLNRQKELMVSDIFWEVFQELEKVVKETDYLFNPLVQIKNFGYDRSFEEVEKMEGNFAEQNFPQNTNFKEITIEKENQKIILTENQELDFGGFLKGYLAEKVSKKFLKKFLGSIVNFGGDIYLQGRDENGEKFLMNVFNPLTEEDIPLGKLENIALTTSGTYKRKWKNKNQEISHVLNHQGEPPSSNLISASILSPSGGLADAWATVSISLGSEKAEIILREKKLKFLLIDKNGKIIKN